MELKGKNIIITGAGGGIGSQLAFAFADRGSNLSLVDLSGESLVPVIAKCREKGAKAIGVVADITKDDNVERIVNETVEGIGGIDCLVNNAGVMPFKLIQNHTGRDILNTFMVNVYGVMMLTNSVLPHMLKRGVGRIVNVGSIFGSIAFPYYGIYSASKWAIRGYSEALRRELQGTGVGVTYIAPRATRTFQPEWFFEMARRTGMNLDHPEKVASVVLDAVSKDRKEVYVGRPERLFVFLNKFFPFIIDRGLRKKAEIMAEYCSYFSR